MFDRKDKDREKRAYLQYKKGTEGGGHVHPNQKMDTTLEKGEDAVHHFCVVEGEIVGILHAEEVEEGEGGSFQLVLCRGEKRDGSTQFVFRLGGGEGGKKKKKKTKKKRRKEWPGSLS